MVYLWLVLLGLCLGSFVNALVWRLREQEILLETKPKGIGKKLKKLSITTGHSMCTHCSHPLAPKDLIPVVSWVSLGGKCRYCRKPIVDTPFTEILAPILFVISYYVWPFASEGWNVYTISAFACWLLMLTGFLALSVYDYKWYILPDKIIIWVTILSGLMVVLLAHSLQSWVFVRDAILAATLFFGFFYMLYSISDGKWIGGGDVKLAFCLGLIAGSPLAVFIAIFFASIIGTISAVPGLLKRGKTLKSMLPFGPALMLATIIVFFWGSKITAWYLGY